MAKAQASPPPDRPTRQVFPFAALVGQETLKLALILAAIDPAIGGVLARGQKGTAKSTAVRGLAALLPARTVVAGCALGCRPDHPQELCPRCAGRLAADGALPHRQRPAPVVDLPLNASEDMVLGGLDFGRTLRDGRRHFQPGLLARAHGGFLYVDEVNLLDDHLVDAVLDAAASGLNRVEREGVSFVHRTEFALVGTMNPEEGELRPQLLDRFGLCVEVAGEPDPEQRVRLMTLREEFDADPGGFNARWQGRDQAVARAIQAARALLPAVRLGASLRRFIARLCLEANVAGHRADLALGRAAAALAAHEGRTQATEADVARCAPLVLAHRRREATPPPPPPASEPEPPPAPEPETPEDAAGPQNQPEPPPDAPDEGEQAPPPPEADQSEPPAGDQPDQQVFAVGDTFRVRALDTPPDRRLRRGSGRRSVSRSAQRQGRYVKSALRGDHRDLALDATLRAAAPHQRRRANPSGLAVCILAHDLRCKVREKKVGNFLLFLVDASGSMGARARMAATKGAIMSLLLDAYQKRDQVALVTFRGREAQTSLPPTASIDTAARLLAELPVGGRTPLAAGLVLAHQELGRQLRKDPDCRPLVLILTDGKANAPWEPGRPAAAEALAIAERLATEARGRVRWVVVDTERAGGVRLGLAGRLARALGGDLFTIDHLKAQDLVVLARSEQP